MLNKFFKKHSKKYHFYVKKTRIFPRLWFYTKRFEEMLVGEYLQYRYFKVNWNSYVRLSLITSEAGKINISKYYIG